MTMWIPDFIMSSNREYFKNFGIIGETRTKPGTWVKPGRAIIF